MMPIAVPDSEDVEHEVHLLQSQLEQLLSQQIAQERYLQTNAPLLHIWRSRCAGS